MKQLDRFSRFETGVYQLLAYFIIWGAPLGLIYVVDAFLLKNLSPLVRYPLLAVCAIVGFMAGLGIAGSVEDFFGSIRKSLGMKPLSELVTEIAEERENAELSKEERKRQWFANCSENEQRYSVWELQQSQFEHLKAISSSLEAIKFLLIGLLVFFVASKIF